jgi:hypothetical protein
MAAREPKELWLLPGMGHAESACRQELVDRMGHWVDLATRDLIAAPAADPDGSRMTATGTGPRASTPDAAA